MNIILDRFPAHHLDQVSNAMSNAGLTVVFSSVGGKSAAEKLARHPRSVVARDFDISNGSFFSETPWTLSRDQIVALSEFEGLFVKLLSRFSLVVSNWSVNEMSDHFYRLCNFWNYQIISKEVRAVFSFYEPHDPSSFSLYVLTKQLKLPYLFLDLPVIAGRIRFLSLSFSERNLLLRRGDANVSSQINTILKDYFDTVRSDFQKSRIPTMRNFYKNYVDKSWLNLKQSTISSIFRLFDRVRGLRNVNDIIFFVGLVWRRILPHTPMYIKYDRRMWFKYDFKGNSLIWLFSRLKSRFRVFKLSRSYSLNCTIRSIADLPDRYCIFAAPLEPEASSIPCAVSGGSVELFIDQILSELPDGAKLVYRVNPAQFKPDYAIRSTGIDWHRESFYSDLVEKGVLLSSPDIEIQDLIEKSFAVATINGTIGAEAISLGRPVVLSSPMWYDNADGVYVYSDAFGLKDFLYRAYTFSLLVDPALVNLSDDSAFPINEIDDPNDLSADDIDALSQKFIHCFGLWVNELQDDNRVWKL